MIYLKKVLALVEVLKDESDRGLVFVGTEFLNKYLFDMLRNYFVDDSRVIESLIGSKDSGGLKPFSTFSSRIDLAFDLGLIDATEHKDIVLILLVPTLMKSLTLQ